MTGPRLEIDLAKIEANTRHLVNQLEPMGVEVTGVTKAVLGSPAVGAAMLRGGARGLGDSRVENLARLAAGLDAPRTLIRTPMLSQVNQVVQFADTSLNTGATVLDALDEAAQAHGTHHGVVLMIELGDLREGVGAGDVAELARLVVDRRGLRLAGLGTNLACQNGVVPDQRNMAELSRVVETCESATGVVMEVVSGGNSANLPWVLGTADVGRITNLRIGEAILLGTEPLERTVLPAMHADAFCLVGEVIEVGVKPSQPWGDRGQSAHGEAPVHGVANGGTTRQAIVALGRQDVDIDTLQVPAGLRILGMSSDHLVIDQGDHRLAVGDEIRFGVGYAALVRAMTSPFVSTVMSA